MANLGRQPTELKIYPLRIARIVGIRGDGSELSIKVRAD